MALRKRSSNHRWWRGGLIFISLLAAGMAIPAAAWAATGVTVSPNPAEEGQTVTITVTGFPDGAQLACLLSGPGLTELEVAEVFVNGSGEGTAHAQIPRALTPGPATRFTVKCEVVNGSFSRSTGIEIKPKATLRQVTSVSGGSGVAINAKGQLLANTSTSSPVDYIPSFLAASLAPLTLDPLPGASQGAEALGLTEDPLVAGWSFTSGNAARHAVVWNTATPGSPADLGTLAGGTNSRALAVNDSGLVVGNSEVTGGDLHAFSCAFSAGACSGGLQDLGTLGGSSSFATGVNDSGEIVGSSTLSGGATHAFLYSGGTMYDLGTLGGTTSNAYAINAAGQVVGDSKDASGNTHAFLWTPDSPNGTTGTMLDLETLGGSFSHAYAINNLGQVVGDALTASSGYHVFLYSGGEMFDMQSAMPPGSPVLESGSGINDLGQIVASDSSYPVLLNPVGAIGAAAVNNSGFSPTSLSIAFGGTAEWSNVGSKSHNVSDAGAMNLFHSGALGPTAAYTFSFVGAGTYTYTDTTDGAKATVKVTMSRAPANGTASTLFQIYFAAGPPPTGFAYDVQVLHPGSKTWSNLKVGTTTPLLAFKPNAGTGKYEFRARIRKKSTGATSGWSPTEAISVT